jgi:hypothetical protein
MGVIYQVEWEAPYLGSEVRKIGQPSRIHRLVRKQILILDSVPFFLFPIIRTGCGENRIFPSGIINSVFTKLIKILTFTFQ